MDEVSGPERAPGRRPRHETLPGVVLVADRVPTRLRRPADLLEALFSFGGLLLVIMLGLFAHSTTQAVAEDFRQVLGGLVRQVLRMPFSLIESFFIVISPAAVIISLVVRGRYRTVLNVLATGMMAALIGGALTLAVPRMPSMLVDSLLVRTPSGSVISLDVVIVVLAAGLTVASGTQQNTAVRLSWWGIWFLLVVGLIWGTATVPGVAVTVLLGRTIGCLARWFFGFDDRRALPADLVRGLLDMGITPSKIIRSDLQTDVAPLETWIVKAKSPAESESSHAPLQLITEPTHSEDTADYRVPSTRGRLADRTYRVWVEDGGQLDLHVLDPGREVSTTIEELWDNIRLRGFSRWISPTLQANAERASLAANTAHEGGVRTPRARGIARGGDSIMIAWSPTPLTAPLLAMREAELEISDEILGQCWLQLIDAHARGVAHRNIDETSLSVDENGDVWLLDWGQGEVAARDLDRNIDCAQMLTYLAEVVGPDRALDSALPFFSRQQLMAIAVVMQSAILPQGIRKRARREGILDKLRSVIATAAEATEEAVAPIRLQRFAPRTLILVAVGAIAAIAVFGSLNFGEILTAVRGANPWWILVAFLLGATTWVAAAIPLVAFSPKKLSLFRTTLVQVAASIVSLVAPAGIGPAALNLRFLTKQKMTLPVAAATVTLVQISQVLTSILLLIGLIALTGTSVSLPTPSMTIIWVIAAVFAVLAGLLAIPKIRNWAWAKSKELWSQIRPQMLWLAGHPGDLVIALLGNLLMNVGFVGAFAASLLAFDYHLGILTVTVTFLVANSIGAVVPSPGGIGTIEAALTAGLQVAGVPPAAAVSAAVLFRLVTFYGRIPFGWLALHYIQKKNIV